MNFFRAPHALRECSFERLSTASGCGNRRMRSNDSSSHVPFSVISFQYPRPHGWRQTSGGEIASGASAAFKKAKDQKPRAFLDVSYRDDSCLRLPAETRREGRIVFLVGPWSFGPLLLSSSGLLVFNSCAHHAHRMTPPASNAVKSTSRIFHYFSIVCTCQSWPRNTASQSVSDLTRLELPSFAA